MPMAHPDEPPADGELPLPPRPAAEVLVPRLSAAELRRELQRLEAERDSAQRALGGQVVDMARQGALSPALLADGAAAVRSRQDQIDAITAALGGKVPSRPPPSGTRRATLLAALIAVGIAGAVAGAFIERRHDDASAAPVTAYSVFTETLEAKPPPTVTVTAPRPVSTRVKAVAVRARGGRAVARPQ
jgi:hypothetical protein